MVSRVEERVPKRSSKVTPKAPTSPFKKPLQADFKALFKALAKGAGHTAIGKWEELGNDTVEALTAIGLATDPAELSFLLIRRSVTKALFALVGESASQLLNEGKKDSESLVDQLDFSLSSREVWVDRRFLDRPASLPTLVDLRALLQTWLEAHGLSSPTATAISDRLPSYFTYELNQEWRRNAKAYRPILDAIDTPFAKAGDREWAWATYAALLQRHIQESVFDEPFSLEQIYVPLNAYYFDDVTPDDPAVPMSHAGRRRRR